MKTNTSVACILLLFPICLVAGGTGCGGKETRPTPPDLQATDGTDVARIKAMADGTVLLEDETVSLDELKARFAALKKSGGAVWYYREQAGGEAPPEAMAVIEAVVETRLPIRLCTKPDFSDADGPPGTPPAGR